MEIYLIAIPLFFAAAALIAEIADKFMIIY